MHSHLRQALDMLTSRVVSDQRTTEPRDVRMARAEASGRNLAMMRAIR